MEQERLAAVGATGLRAAPDAVLDRIAGLVRRVLDVPVALVSLVEADRQIFPGQVGLSERWAAERGTPLSHSFCRRVVASGEPLVVEDARTHPDLSTNPAIADLGVVAYAGFPLTDARGHVLGSLCAIDPAPRAWSAQDLETLADLAAVCSAELRLRIAATAAQAAVSRSTVLADVSRAVFSTLDSDEAAARLSRLVVPSLAEWGVVGLLEESGRFRASFARHRDPERGADVERAAALLLETLDPQSPLRLVVRSAEALHLPDAPAGLAVGLDADEAVPLLEGLGSGSALLVPLRSRSDVLGVLVLVSPEGTAFEEADLQAAHDVGRRTGMALENAELYRRQRRFSEALQRSLLTRLPEPDHLHVAARYRAAAQEAQVGGDWYDAFQQADGATVLVVGDVMGHDSAAAAAMGQLRGLMRGIAYDRAEPPASVLSRVDAALPGLDVATLATCVVARVEQAEDDRREGLRTFRWSNAGHPPPLLLHADGTVEVLERPSDLLLGLDPGMGREDHTVTLLPDDTVVLFTDGLVERRDSPIEHGLARLRQALASLAGRPLDELLDELLVRLLPDDSEDDVVVIAVQAYAEDRPRPVHAGRSGRAQAPQEA